MGAKHGKSWFVVHFPQVFHRCCGWLLRLDPFHTGFDEHAGAGAFIELAPGLYEVGVRRTAPGKVRLSFAPLPETTPPALLELAALTLS